MGVHEINIHDIIDLISKDSEFLNGLQKNLAKENIMQYYIQQFRNTNYSKNKKKRKLNS